jgi:hypothetical protein
VGSLVLNYPHCTTSFAARPLKAGSVWRVAQRARDQLLSHPRRPKIDVTTIAARCRRLHINRIAFETRFEFDEQVADRDGHPVLGATEYHDSCPDSALVYVNMRPIGDAQELARSTTLHELGHVTFDAPSWVVHARRGVDVPQPPSRAELKGDGDQDSYGPQREPRDWSEWRANEFMGGFLLPRQLLHEAMIRKAAALGLPMVEAAGEPLPVVSGRRASPDRLDEMVLELSELFGVSVPFVEVRLRKYRLIVMEGAADGPSF